MTLTDWLCIQQLLTERVYVLEDIRKYGVFEGHKYLLDIKRARLLYINYELRILQIKLVSSE